MEIRQHRFIWDILLKNEKTDKITQKNFKESIQNYIEIHNDPNFKKYSVFDFRIKGQLIFKLSSQLIKYFIDELDDQYLKIAGFQDDELNFKIIATEVIFTNNFENGQIKDLERCVIDLKTV